MADDHEGWVMGDDGEEYLPYGDHSCVDRDGVYRRYVEAPEDLKYTCDQCGACCRRWIVDIDVADVLREPRFLEGAVGWSLEDGRLITPEGEPTSELNIACGRHHPCMFLGADNLCGCHATKPMVCAEFQAGSRQCQAARYNEGLPPLAPDA
jgi:Fe-S-cluster containining protein